VDRRVSKVRQVLPGKTRLLTRRALERRFFFKPCAAVNQLVKYVLAVAAAKYAVRLIVAYVGSNHYHLEVDDPHGRYPRFAQYLDGLLARAVNCYRKRTDTVWDGQQLNGPELADPEAVVDRAAYALANAVKDGLVERGRDWPGFRSSPQACTRPPEEVARPDFFFDQSERGKMPATAKLTFHVPREFEHLGAKGWAKLLADRVAAHEERAREEHRAAGRSFLGARGVKKQSWKARAKSHEKRGPKHVLHPIVIARDAAARLDVIVRHKTFEREHAAALEALLEGDKDVEFPHGTYQARLRYGVRCRPPP
jgi:REP element-mobilizing transposase RayT